MGQAAQDVSDADVGGGGAGAEQRVGGAGADDHVHAGAGLLGAAAVEDAVKDADDGKDHNDLNRNGKGADDGAQRTVHEIADDQFVHGVSETKFIVA